MPLREIPRGSTSTPRGEGVAPSSLQVRGAVKYQIVIMFLIASATALGTVSVVLLSYRRLFNDHHQFLDALIAGPSSTPKGRW
jgi:hypothetical protein